jgi:hypothetical protein
VAKALALALLVTLIPTAPAQAVPPPAVVTQLTSNSTINYSTNPPSSGFDVAWQFGSGSIPADFGLLTCRMEFEYQGNGPIYPYRTYLTGSPYSYTFTEASWSMAATQALSSSSLRVDIDAANLGLYFFRAFPAGYNFSGVSDPLSAADNFCDAPIAGIPTTEFKVSQTPLLVEKATNPYSPNSVFTSDVVAFLGSTNFTDATTPSAPLVTFNASPYSKDLVLVSGAFKVKVGNQVESPTSSNSCSRNIDTNTNWFFQGSIPDDQGDTSGQSVSVNGPNNTQFVYLLSCSWDNFPLQQSELSNPNFFGRSVSNQVVANLPNTFPDSTHGYALSTNSSVANPALVKAQPLTTELNLNYVRGDAMAPYVSFEPNSLTSAELTLSLPTEVSAFRAIRGHFLTYESDDASHSGNGGFSHDGQADPVTNATFSYTLPYLSPITYSAYLYSRNDWTQWRSNQLVFNPANVRYTASFDVNGYDQYHQAPAPRGNTHGKSILLPTFSYPATTFSGWVNNGTLYQPGEPFTLSQDITFTASFSDVGLYKFNGLTVTSSQPTQFEFFPAFDPDVTDYYLNIGHQEFDPITIEVDAAFRGIANSEEFLQPCGPTAFSNMPNLVPGHSTFQLVHQDFPNQNCNGVFGSGTQLTLRLGGVSEYAFNNSEPSGIVYTIHIVRNLFQGNWTSLDFVTRSPDVQGTLPSFSLGPKRYVQLPDQGNLSRPGYIFIGWQEAVDGFASFDAGDVVLLDENLLLEPIWMSDIASLSVFGVDGINWDSEQTVSYRILNVAGGVASVSVEVDSFGPYRLTLFNHAGTVVSRFSNHPSYSAQTLNANSSSMELPAACQTPDLSGCGVTISMMLEYWNQSLDFGVSKSIQILAASTSEMVCSFTYRFHPLDSVEDYTDCDVGGTWVRARPPSWYSYFSQSYQVLENGNAFYLDPNEEDAYAFLGYSLDPEDDGSGVWQPEEYRPVFSNTALYSIWEKEVSPEISDVTLFGKNYDVETCFSFRANQPDTVSCLSSGPMDTNYPYGTGANWWYLAQEFTPLSTTTSFAISFSNSSLLEFDYWARYADLSEGFGETPDYGGSSYSRSIPLADFCPQNVCPAVFYIDVSVASKRGLITRDFSIKVILARPNTQLNFNFDLAGGTGPSNSYVPQDATWITPPSLDNAIKPGYRPDGWIIESGNNTMRVLGDAPAPLLFDNQTISTVWVPAYRVEFLDGFTDSPITFRYVDWTQNQPAPAWNDYWYIPDPPTHPQGYDFLGWTVVSGSDQVISFDGLTINQDRNFYPVWDYPQPTSSSQAQNQNSNPPSPPVTSNPQPVVTPPATVSPTPPTNSPGATSSNSVSPSTSTSLGFVRVNGKTVVQVGLPAKYIGKTATIEVKRWVNNRVRYYVLDASKVLAPTSSQAGNAALRFDFKLILKPTDTIRIKVGKVQVLKAKATR